MGIFFFALPYAPVLRSSLTTTLIDEPEIFQKVGLGLLILGAFLFVGLYLLNRKRYLKLKMDGYKASVEENVVRASIQSYFKALFPDIDLTTDVVITGKKHLEILANLPTPQEDLLETIQNELGILLSRRLGYQREFSFTLVQR